LNGLAADTELDERLPIGSASYASVLGWTTGRVF
jgi:hypothetical protein